MPGDEDLGDPEPQEESESVGETSPEATEETGEDDVTGDEGVEETGAKDADTDKEVIDQRGPDAELPEGETIVAVGELAGMVTVLGCGSSLVATDAEFAKKAQEYADSGDSEFSEITHAEILWEGDGLAGISDENFERLLELEPDIVVYISGSDTLSTKQVATLKKNGIESQALAEMTAPKYVYANIRALAEMLGDEDVSERAEEYVDWSEETLNAVYKKAKGTSYYTLYVDAWDPEVEISLDIQGGDLLETGAAVIKNKYYASTQAVSEYLKYASVSNTVSMSSYSSNKMTGYFFPMYMLGAYNMGNARYTLKGGTLASGAFAYTSYNCFTFKSVKGDNPLSTLPYSLGGGEQFQYVVAADKSTADGIDASRESDAGFWHFYTTKSFWGVEDTQGIGYVAWSFKDIYGNSSDMMSFIGGEYSVLVNPQGWLSWTEGGCESVLEPVWAAYAISGGIDETKMKNYIKDYYKTFYGKSLSGDELAEILEGN